MMYVLEIYQSRQGEGIWTGQPSVFVRFSRCPLYCRFCDTSYARQHTDESVVLTLEEILGRVMLFDVPHVVLTGGEPMLHGEIVELSQMLKTRNRHITIETSGIIYQPVECDLMSICPKLGNSVPVASDLSIIEKHDRRRFRPDIVQQLLSQYTYQLKFVVDRKADFCEIEDYLAQLHGVVRERVFLMPQAVDAETIQQKKVWIEPYCQDKGYRFCPRMQLIWYGGKRRT